MDITYSCAVSHDRLANLYASVTLSPKHPGGLSMTTGVKMQISNGTMTMESQLGLQAGTKKLTLDKKNCHRAARIPLKPKGFKGGSFTVTPGSRGYDSERCDTSARVVFRLRLTMRNGTPSHAIVVVRNDNAKSKPIVFYDWTPSKFREYIGPSCTTVG